MADRRLDILAVGPLPFSIDGRATFELGGSVVHAELLSALARLGHAVRVIAEAPSPAAGVGDEPSRCGGDLPDVAVEWFALEYRSAMRPPPADFVEAQRRRVAALMHRLTERRTPDVVILGREWLAWSALDVCRDLELPTLLISMGVPVAGLQSGLYPEEATRRMIDRLRRVDMVVTVARHLEESLRALGVTRVRTIRNVVDAGRFRPGSKDGRLLAGLGVPPDRFVVGSFSSLRDIKRPLDVVASAEAVLRAEPQTLYLVAGDGPLRGEVEQAVRSHGISDAFRIVGEIPRSLVPAYMNLVDVVVHASELEGFPLVYREAQACARTLLASDIPPAREAVIDRETGVLFRLGDRAELTAKTLAMARDGDRRAAVGRSARRVAASESVDDWAGAYSEALLEVAAARR